MQFIINGFLSIATKFSISFLSVGKQSMHSISGLLLPSAYFTQCTDSILGRNQHGLQMMKYAF